MRLSRLALANRTGRAGGRPVRKFQGGAWQMRQSDEHLGCAPLPDRNVFFLGVSSRLDGDFGPAFRGTDESQICRRSADPLAILHIVGSGAMRPSTTRWEPISSYRCEVSGNCRLVGAISAKRGKDGLALVGY
jgi:hypothetical protein